MSAYMALALSCQQCRVQKSMVLDVKSPHPFLYLFLSGTDIPINASRRYHVIPTAIQTTQPCLIDPWLWEKRQKKLSPSAPPTSKAGMVAGPACCRILRTTAAAWDSLAAFASN